MHEKAYKFIVCECGGFQNVSLHRESTDSQPKVFQIIILTMVGLR